MTAREILDEALQRYRQPNGYEGDLVDAADRLAWMGRDALPALRDLALSGAPECEYFVAAIARTKGLTVGEAGELILILATHPVADVRARLAEVIADCPVRQRLFRLYQEGKTHG